MAVLQDLKYMKKILTLVLILWSIGLNAQNKSDSLLSIWNNTELDDTTRLNALYTLSDQVFRELRLDSALSYAQIHYAFATNQGLIKQMGESANLQARINWNHRNYGEANRFFHKYIELLEYSDDKQKISATLNLLGILHGQMGDPVNGLMYYQESLLISEEIGDEETASSTQSNIGELFKEQGDYLKALEYYFQALKTKEKIKDQAGRNNLISLGTVYLNIGEVYSLQGSYDTATMYFDQCRKYYEESNDKNGLGNVERYTGIMYFNQGDYKRALVYYRNSLAIHSKSFYKRHMATDLVHIGIAHLKLRQYQDATFECERALKLAEELENISLKRSCVSCLYDGNKALGKSAKALLYLEQFHLYDDSLKSKELSISLQQMEFQKQVLHDSLAQVEEARLLEISHLIQIKQKEQTRNIGFSVAILIFIFSGFLYNRLHYLRKSKAIIEKEKDRSDTLLLNILPEEVAQELKDKGKANARSFEMVSIVFTDFIEFTQFSAKLSPEELVREIHECFEAFDAICDQFQIEKIKTIGDAYMAAGGIPMPITDAAKKTVLAALAMQDFVQKRKAAMDLKGLPSFEMRVGIHSGPVVAGIVGAKKFQYDLWGDAVNTASRVESHGEVGKVNISQVTYSLLKNDLDFSFESRGTIEVKGKGEMEMWFVKLQK